MTGVSITVIISLILGIKNRKTLYELWKALMQTVDKKDVLKVPDRIVADNVETVIMDVPKAEIIDFSSAHSSYREPFDVSKHLRNLPEGMHPSSEKVATALEHGFELAPGQTWVDNYVKGGTVA